MNMQDNLMESSTEQVVDKGKKHIILGHPILWCILGIPLAMIVTSVTSSPLKMLLSSVMQEGELQSFLGTMITNMCYIVISFLLVMIAKHSYGDSFHTGLTKKNFGLSLQLASTASIIVFANIVTSMLKHADHAEGLLEVLTVIASGMTIGIAEELCARTFVIENAMQTWKNKKYGIYTTLFVSSLGFGVLHFINLTSGENSFFEILALVCFASAIGILFGAVYLRTRNVLGSILLHGVIDVSDFFYTEGELTAEANVMMMSTLFVLCIFALIIGLYLVRKSKMQEIEEVWEIHRDRQISQQEE